MRLWLAVGHGNNGRGVFDPGATSASGAWNEQTAGDHVVGAAAQVLTAAGADVRSEARTDDGNWPWTGRQANRWGADIVIAWHHDWSGGVDGGHGFWWPGSDDGEALCRKIMDGHEAAGLAVRWDWVKPRSDLGLLRGTEATTVLVECGRIGDMTLDSPDELRAVGRAHGMAIAAHLHLTPDRTKEHDMGWLDRWPRWARPWAEKAEARGVITEQTDPDRPIGEVPTGEFMILLDGGVDGVRGEWDGR